MSKLYRATYRFIKDDPSSDREITWVKAKEGAEVFPHEHVFNPVWWNDESPWSGVGEIPGTKKTYTFPPGRCNLPGKKFLGTPSQWLNGCSKTDKKYWIAPDGSLLTTNPCPNILPLPCVETLYAKGNYRRMGDVNFTQQQTLQPEAVATYRPEYHPELTQTLNPVPSCIYRPEYHLASVQTLTVSADLFDIGEIVFVFEQTLDVLGGFLLDGAIAIFANQTLTTSGECVYAPTIEFDGEQTLTATCNMQLGGITAMSATTTLVADGEVSEGGVTPGNSCETAALITLPFTQQIENVHTNDWFKWGATNGVTYHVTVSDISGGTPFGAQINHGSSCPPFFDTNVPLPGCGQATAGSNTTMYFKFEGSFFDTITYTVTIDTGSC